MVLVNVRVAVPMLQWQLMPLAAMDSNPHMQKLVMHCCSIVYWPALQCGIKSSRVLKKAGKVRCIELVHPMSWFLADVSMLFLTEVYIVWVTNMGFKDVHLKRSGTLGF
jgi:hypothetical protein